MDKRIENFWRVRSLQDKIAELDIKYWLHDEFLTGSWWLLLVFLILPWIIWSIFLNRKQILETLLFGTFIIIITFLLDLIGIMFRFWGYITQFLPIYPGALPFDFSMVPVTFMFLYQYFRTWRSFIVSLICMASAFSFIGEPFSIWAHLVIYIKWKYIYSFIYYIVIGIIVRACVEKLVAISKSQRLLQ
ncbi:CBO0543 family protein [Priestia megaterium]|uniref:CBO0543 family protein n=1 Tax=Priestia megaterium TaxID=1404 RepID=UPI002A6B8754|nr:CBO0543 family protein [Priestia megaterium]MDY0944034.1 CBO0543 family protein [Priestia megaterium]